MTRKFNGKNNMGPVRRLFYERANYYVNAYTEDTPELKDLAFFEMLFYGMIDDEDDSIMINQEFLKPLKATDNPGSVLTALDFVADAFDDFRKSFQYACNAGYVDKSNPYFAAMEAKRAYRSPIVDYERDLAKIFMKYNTEIIPQHLDINNITSFEHYVNNFLNFIKNDTSRTPLTMAKWCRSTKAGIFHSGLAIDIAGLDIDSDQTKVDSFIDDKNFEFYRQVALNRGFCIVENAPFVLLADLQSPAMAPYLAKYRLKNIKDVFNTRYNKVYNTNINIIKRIVLKYYNFFTIRNRRAKKIKTCNGKTIVKYTRRKPITPDSIDDKVWLDIYISFRNYEEGHPFSEHRIKSIKKIAKTFDSEEVMGYINNTFGNQTWNKPFGYDDYIRNVRKPIKSAPFVGNSNDGGNTTY